jgi:hypothetical protein
MTLTAENVAALLNRLDRDAMERLATSRVEIKPEAVHPDLPVRKDETGKLVVGFLGVLNYLLWSVGERAVVAVVDETPGGLRLTAFASGVTKEEYERCR